jgi:hypothetical protein
MTETNLLQGNRLETAWRLLAGLLACFIGMGNLLRPSPVHADYIVLSYNLGEDSKAGHFIGVVEGDISLDPKTRGLNLKHAWGSCTLRPGDPRISFIPINATVAKSVPVYIEERTKEWARTPFRTLVEMILLWNQPWGPDAKIDMRAKIEELLAELEKTKAVPPEEMPRFQRLLQVRAYLDPGKSLPTPTAIQQTRDLLTQLKKQADQQLGGTGVVNPAATGLNPGFPYAYSTSAHYIMFHSKADRTWLDRWLARLERHQAGWLYWLALQNVEFQFPKERLVCFLVDNEQEFRTIRDLYSYGKQSVEGFCTPENMLVIHPARLDAGFRSFRAVFNTTSSEVNAAGAALGINLGIDSFYKGRLKGKEAQILQHPAASSWTAIGLLHEAAQEEGAVHIVTHQGSIQLAGATGLISPRILLPQAVRTGFASVFETPRSMGEANVPVFWNSMTKPHWLYAEIFNELQNPQNRDTGVQLGGLKIPAQPEPDFVRALSDENFRKAQQITDDREREAATIRAHVDAWAATHYLMNHNFPGLLRFYGELDKLPREREVTPALVEEALGRALGVYDKELRRSSPDRLAVLNREWLDKMRFAFITELRSYRQRSGSN